MNDNLILKIKDNLSDIEKLKIDSIKKLFAIFQNEFDEFYNKGKVPFKYTNKKSFFYLFVIKIKYFNLQKIKIQEIIDEDLRMIIAFMTDHHYSELVKIDQEDLVKTVEKILSDNNFPPTFFSDDILLDNICDFYQTFKNFEYSNSNSSNVNKYLVLSFNKIEEIINFTMNKIVNDKKILNILKLDLKRLKIELSEVIKKDNILLSQEKKDEILAILNSNIPDNVLLARKEKLYLTEILDNLFITSKL